MTVTIQTVPQPSEEMSNPMDSTPDLPANWHVGDPLPSAKSSGDQAPTHQQHRGASPKKREHPLHPLRTNSSTPKALRIVV
ncbi:hypothetical protein PoB_001910300 [Plakobranchus ocellatus]|uniref:Uncharacterized protein n=1 Tax=Plakobranchus ocellatus TaxID=259542 RepID=A0AAV3ZD01_9GAST|nr:hypothetical protein PoB_001910300 [Plakobranchus ocellatus]